MGRRLNAWKRNAFRRKSKRAKDVDLDGEGDGSSDVEGARDENENTDDEEAETRMMGDEGDDVISGESGGVGALPRQLVKKGSFLGIKEEPRVTTVKEAVLSYDSDRLKELLEEGALLEDGLLYAVSSGCEHTVRTICEFLATKDAMECYKVINQFAIGSEFLPSTTALQLASKENDYDVVQTLIRYGAELPELITCLSMPGVRDDSLVQCFAYLQYIKAMASPSLILLTETNPVGRALRVAVDLSEYRLTSKKVTRTLQSHPSFTEQIDSVVESTGDLISNLLDHCKSKREIEVFLDTPATIKTRRHRRSKNRPEKVKESASDMPEGLENAKMLGFKKIVAHPFSQMIVTDRIFHGPVDWEEMSSTRFFLLSAMVVVFSPILCLGYSFVPVKKLVQFMSTPYVRLLSGISSNLFFLLFLLLTALNVRYTSADCPEVIHEYIDTAQYCTQVTPMFWPIYGRSVLIMLVTLGQIMWMISTMHKIGVWPLFQQSWSWVLLTQMLLFLSSFVLYMVSLFKVQTFGFETDSGFLVILNRQPSNITVFFDLDEVLYQPSRATWNSFDSQILAELTFALANILTAQRLLYTFIFSERLGPLIISVSRMMGSLMKFALVTLLILGSFTLGFAQLYAPYADIHECDSGTDPDDEYHCGNAEMFSSIRMSLHTLFWAIFGEFKISDMSLPANLYLVEVTGQILHAIYIITTSIIILNMLIAALLTAYEGIQADVYTEWKFSRTKMLQQFCGNRSNIPPPYNLIPSVRVIMSALRKLAATFIKVLVRLGVKVPEQYTERAKHNWKRTVPQDEETQRNKEEMQSERCEVMYTLVARYKREYWKVTPPNRPSSRGSSRSTSRGPSSPVDPFSPLGSNASFPVGQIPADRPQPHSVNGVGEPTSPLEVITEVAPLNEIQSTGSNGDHGRRKPASVSLV